MGLTKPIEQICNLLIEQIKIVSKRYYTRIRTYETENRNKYAALSDDA